MTDTLLETKDLYYTYDDGTQALKGVSVKIRKGKTTAILGGNGAGKSTLFLNFNGILKPAAGEVYFKARPIEYSQKGLKGLRRSVGLVFQDPDRQLFSASVFQDVSFGLMNLELPEGEIRRRVEDVLQRTGVSDLMEKPTHYLSSGQKKRAAIAGVLVMEPELLIIDEPTAGLDPMGVIGIMNLLDEAKEQGGISVVISTHDIDLVPLYCDYVYVMDQGKIILEGTPKEVFTEAETLRKIHLRLPRITHLLEILQKKDGFVFNESAVTISEARRLLKKWNQREVLETT